LDPVKLKIHLNGQVYDVQLEKNGGDYRVSVGESAYNVTLKDDGLSIDGEFIPVKFEGPLDEGAQVTIQNRTMQARVESLMELEKMEAVQEDSSPASASKEQQGTITAPMPGKIVSVKVKVGDKVGPDTLICVLEAMKMENEILSGVSGTVKEIKVKPGETVEGGKTLVLVE
jgi:biotin carboxyl carrier protein